MGERDTTTRPDHRPTAPRVRRRWARWLAGGVLAGTIALWAAPAAAQETDTSTPQDRAPQVIDLTLERLVEIGMNDSYRVRQLQMGIEASRHRLQASEAQLKSNVSLRLSTPRFSAVSDYKWNSDLQRNEIVHENTRRWQADLSIDQPVILFGFPTDGSLSLNSRVYRYTQLDGDERDIRYYNRYFVAYRQPFFQVNNMRNNLEEAQLNLESRELRYQSDIVRLVDNLANDYFWTFEEAYEKEIYEEYVEQLQEAAAAAEELARDDPERTTEPDRIRVELANAREQVNQRESSLRRRFTQMKQDLRIPESDSLVINPVLEVEPVEVDLERAIEYGTTLAPRMRQLDIGMRRNEIDLEEAGDRNSFRMDLNLTYGREMQDPRFGHLWQEPTNTYSVEVSAYLPIWDWGAQKHRLEAERIEFESEVMEYEQNQRDVILNIENEVRNIEEYQTRVLNMEENLELAEEGTRASLQRYREGSIGVLELLQVFQQEVDTETNLVDAYLNWRRALLDLQDVTFYDFERDMPVIERFGIAVPEGSQQP